MTDDKEQLETIRKIVCCASIFGGGQCPRTITWEQKEALAILKIHDEKVRKESVKEAYHRVLIETHGTEDLGDLRNIIRSGIEQLEKHLRQTP